MTRTRIFILTIFSLLAGSGVRAADTVPNPARAGDDYAISESVFNQNINAKQKGLETIRARLIAHPTYISPDARNPEKVKQFLIALNDQGKFTDLDSADPVKNWVPALGRLNAIATVYRQSSETDRAAMRQRMFAGIERYCDDAVAHPDPFVGASFGAPRNAACIFFSLYDELNQPQRASVRQALKNTLFLCWYYPINLDPARKTDPDRIDVFRQDVHFIVGNFTYRPVVECAVAMDSTRMLDVVRAVTVDSLRNRTSYQTESNSFWGDEGLTVDGGGFAHGRQSYVYGYVRDWLRGVGSIARFFKDTPWEIEPTNWDYAADLVLGAQQWFIYKGDVDWSVNGRHNMYPGPILDGNMLLNGFIDEVLELSQGEVQRKGELLAMKARLKNGGEFDGNRYFWNAEDMVHRRAGYYLSVNACSIRSDGPENAAPFSIVNYYFPFGSMMIKTRGDEYLRARGAMNCSALPGITSDPSRPPPNIENWSGFHGQNTFCGGASDGMNGVCGFILKNDQPISAHKGYFFFDEGMVALGAGVTTGNIETTINQTEWRGPIEWNMGTGMQNAGDAGGKWDLAVHQPVWIDNDDVGYIVLPTDGNARIRMLAEKRPTHWADLAPMNATNPKAATAIEPIFQLSVLHSDGQSHYAYAVLPGMTGEAMSREIDAVPIEVLANTEEVQAVRHRASGMVEAIFYQPGRIHFSSSTLEVDQPAIVMLKPDGAQWILSAADPLQRENAKPLQVWVNFHVSGPNVQSENNRFRITCDFPRAPWIGKTVAYRLAP